MTNHFERNEVEFRLITDWNFDDIVKLEPQPDQQRFVARNVTSLAEAYLSIANNYCVPMPYAIYQMDTLIGSIMWSYNPTNQDAADDEDVYDV